MAVHSVTLDLPSTLYSRVKQRAARTQRSIEDELLDVLASAIPASEELPPDLAEALAPLALLDDAALWRAARSHLPAAVAARLEALHLKRQSEDLTDTESAEVAREEDNLWLACSLCNDYKGDQIAAIDPRHRAALCKCLSGCS